MPNKHVYFALGATHGALLVAWVYFKRRDWFENYRWMRQLYRWEPDWFLYFPLVIGLFGCLGLIPDVLLALNLFSKDMVRSDFFNIFYGYSWLEYMEDKYPDIDHTANTLGSLVLYTLCLGVLTFFARSLSMRIVGAR
jgi:hypothetical protein